MHKNLTIREVDKSEADSLSNLAMRSKTHWGYSKDFMAACRQELLVTPAKIENIKYSFALAEKHGKVVGFYALEKLPDNNYELEALFVEPSLIGSGIGTALIQHAMNIAEANGGRTLHIQSDSNTEKFYQAMGGVHTGERESASIPGRFLPVFSISLASKGIA